MEADGRYLDDFGASPSVTTLSNEVHSTSRARGPHDKCARLGRLLPCLLLRIQGESDGFVGYPNARDASVSAHAVLSARWWGMTTSCAAGTADLYLRLSLDHPGATAIERQEAECRRWCDANGLAVRVVHVDRGVSGYSEREQPHREGFTAALNAVAARLEDADDAFYVRGDLDARRHARITEKLTLKITQTEDAIAAAEPTLDTTRLRDRDYVAQRWTEHAPAGRRALLRLAWSEIHLAKATRPGGSFGEDRIAYYPYTTPNPDRSWPALLYGTPS
jgi:hypothetical protein